VPNNWWRLFQGQFRDIRRVAAGAGSIITQVHINAVHQHTRIGSTSCACKPDFPRHRCSIDIAAASASIHAVKSCCCEVLKIPDRQEATISTTVIHLNRQQTRCQTREKPATARPRPSGSGIASTSTTQSSRTRSSALSLHHLSTLSLRLPHPPRRPHHDPHPSPHYTHPP
jgi:hypothetical protein